MISLCIISRKEDENSLRRAIESCIEEVDEVVVVNTGKGKLGLTPTVEKPFISDTLGGEKVRVIPFKWTGSFADARNFSFEQAKGDIIFTIDSDDVVFQPGNIPKLAKKIEEGSVDWIYCEYIYQRDETGNIIAKHWKPRFFRKGTGHWVGNVHEDFMPDEVVIQKKDTDLGSDRLIIEHTATPDDLLKSSERNLAIQLAELERDGDKVDPRTILYTAMSYQGLGKYEDAIPYFIRLSTITGSKEDKYWALYRAGTCSYIVGRNTDALNLTLDSLKLFPEWKSSYLQMATIYTALEDWSKVIEWTLTGLEKKDPDTLQVVSELDYTILPLGRLAMAYMQTGNYELANQAAIDVYRMNPEYPGSKDLVKMAMESIKLEGFVKSFLEVAQNVKKYDRVKATQLFDLLPKELDEDYRIQQARAIIVPPKRWNDKSVVIYCGKSIEEWSYPSIFSGIGGSEEAVIYMSKELVKQGYSVTVYNRCGDMKGEYDGVNYLPYYYFNKKDTFDTLIIWRNPLAFMDKFNAKHKYLWMHDIAHPEHFNKTIYGNLDKILFLSNWHRNNLPDCPDSKVFITNNGINPSDFEKLPKKKKNSLIWSSSYDRGLLPFIKNILPLIKKEIPDVTLDVAYGWDNITKEMEVIPSLKQLYTELSPILENTKGITHHGRLSHKKLAELMGKCMVYPYASEFGETCNITSQKCQAANCLVVTSKEAGGTWERAIYGIIVKEGSAYTNPQAWAEYAKVIIKHLWGPLGTHDAAWHRQHNPKFKDIGEGIHKSILEQFSWSTTANQWITELL